ncbi:unnamed protein product [Caenorhabditis auriculariae]|uniref:Calmodulin-lysine N-methyltransferase n=1 Tax=Caenorhabditis auriculariae TaxID=2777116 RepID=A0A8S1H7L2_9PELO|nr:unnamed protein product [Caenorhabditis auriculariae]
MNVGSAGFYRGEMPTEVIAKVLRLTAESFEEAVEAASTVLLRGGVVALPTDTLYGLCTLIPYCDRLYSLKRRPLSKPLGVFLRSPGDIPLVARQTVPSELLNKLFPGPVTVIFERTADLPQQFNPGVANIGVRVAPTSLVAAICERVDQPVAQTSANVSGSLFNPTSTADFQDLLRYIDLVLDGGVIQNEKCQASTIVDLTLPGSYKIVRDGFRRDKTEEMLSSFGLELCDRMDPVEEMDDVRRAETADEEAPSTSAAPPVKGSEEFEDFVNDKQQSSRAKRNWQLCAKRLKMILRQKEEVAVDTDFIELRPLLRLVRVVPTGAPGRRRILMSPSLTLDVVVPKTSSVSSLTGFDNTGNVRIWPGSEMLTFLVATGQINLKGKRVLELGAGSMALPGFAAALLGAEVMLTDGNELSVENIQQIVDMNSFQKTPYVRKLVWGEEASDLPQFDLIFAADCVFFEQHRENLLKTIHKFLTPHGVALIASPERKGSLKAFSKLVEAFELVYSADHACNKLITDLVWDFVVKTKNLDENLPRLGLIHREVSKALHYAVIKTADDVLEMDGNEGKTFDDDLLERVTTVVWEKVVEDWSTDLLAFSGHAGRQTVNMDDIALLTRRIPDVFKMACQMAGVEFENKKGQRQRKSKNAEKAVSGVKRQAAEAKEEVLMEDKEDFPLPPKVVPFTSTPRASTKNRERLGPLFNSNITPIRPNTSKIVEQISADDSFDDEDCQVVIATPTIFKQESNEDPLVGKLERTLIEEEKTMRDAKNELPTSSKQVPEAGDQVDKKEDDPSRSNSPDLFSESKKSSKAAPVQSTSKEPAAGKSSKPFSFFTDDEFDEEETAKKPANKEKSPKKTADIAKKETPISNVLKVVSPNASKPFSFDVSFEDEPTAGTSEINKKSPEKPPEMKKRETATSNVSKTATPSVPKPFTFDDSFDEDETPGPSENTKKSPIKLPKSTVSTPTVAKSSGITGSSTVLKPEEKPVVKPSVKPQMDDSFDDDIVIISTTPRPNSKNDSQKAETSKLKPKSTPTPRGKPPKRTRDEKPLKNDKDKSSSTSPNVSKTDGNIPKKKKRFSEIVDSMEDIEFDDDF